MKAYFEDYYRELKQFVDSSLEQENLISEPWSYYFTRLPELYMFCYNIAISGKINNVTLTHLYIAIEYLISPVDFMPELIYGPDGFNEDMYFIALTLSDIHPKIPHELVEQYWTIDKDIENLTAEIIATARENLSEDILKSVDMFYEDYESPSSPKEIYHILTAVEESKPADKIRPEKKKKEQNADRAIHHVDGPGIVFAGPGSGKTYVIENRVFNLINNAGIDPENILVTTFTNKAADELTVRLRERFSDRDDVDKIMSELTISTIHSFCFSLLKQYQHRILFLKETYTPVEEGDQMLFIYRHSGEQFLNIKRFFRYWQNSRLKDGEKRFNLGLFDYYTEVLQIYNFLSEEILGAEDSATQLDFFKIIKSQKPRCFEDNIIASYPKYWQLLLDNGMMDQSIILSYAEALLKYDQILDEVRKKYKYIMVDEYQDTNPVQDRIFRQICGENGNLFVVGDDDQSIYRFRGAEVTNITRFTNRYPGASVFRLNENRRSSKKIVKASKNLIEHNNHRIKKELFSNNEKGDPISLVFCEDEKDQARKAAGLIRQMKTEGHITNLSQVAILFRSVRKPGPIFKKILQEEGIACSITSDKSFFRTDEIKGLLQLFGIIQKEELEIKGRNYTLFFKKAGISDKEVMRGKIESWHQQLYENHYNSLLEMYYSMLQGIDMLNQLENDDTSLGNLGIFSELIASYEGKDNRSLLSDKLYFFNQYCEMLDGGIDQADVEANDSVHLMTIHKSKGLQFDYVIIADVTKRYFPMGYRPGPRQRTKGVILKGPEGRKYDVAEENMNMEEERRIFYVGITRAAKGVYMLTEENNQSDFIHELGKIKIVQKEPYKVEKVPRRVKSSSGRVLHVSHSEIYDYRFCPGRYNFNHRYRFKGQAIQPLFSGLSLHRSLEVLHRLILDNQYTDENILNRIFDRCWIFPFGSEKEKEKERKKNCEVFLDYARTLTNMNGKHQLLQAEYPFMTASGENVLTGKLDLVQKDEDGQLEIVEFKHKRNPLLEAYTVNQLNHYSLAFPDREVKLSAYYLEDREKVSIEPKDKKNIMLELEGDFEKIRNKEFERQPGTKKCSICPVALVCGEKTV